MQQRTAAPAATGEVKAEQPLLLLANEAADMNKAEQPPPQQPNMSAPLQPSSKRYVTGSSVRNMYMLTTLRLIHH
jgi:hypothetical protein